MPFHKITVPGWGIIAGVAVAGLAFLTLALLRGHPGYWFVTGFAFGSLQAMLQFAYAFRKLR